MQQPRALASLCPSRCVLETLADRHGAGWAADVHGHGRPPVTVQEGLFQARGFMLGGQEMGCHEETGGKAVEQ